MQRTHNPLSLGSNPSGPTKFEIDMTINITGPQGPWRRMFAWRPVKIKTKWYWLTTVYVRQRNILVLPDQGVEYGDVFDVLHSPSL